MSGRSFVPEKDEGASRLGPGLPGDKLGRDGQPGPIEGRAKPSGVRPHPPQPRSVLSEVRLDGLLPGEGRTTVPASAFSAEGVPGGSTGLSCPACRNSYSPDDQSRTARSRIRRKCFTFRVTMVRPRTSAVPASRTSTSPMSSPLRQRSAQISAERPSAFQSSGRTRFSEQNRSNAAS